MKKRLLLPFAAIVLLALSAGGQFCLHALRDAKKPAIAQSAFAALGGLRSVVSEIIWFRADRLRDEGRYVELAQLAQLLVHMEPHTPEVWTYSAWNLAYNISIMMTTYEDRWRWVYAAVCLLRDDAIRYNPREACLYRELAWMFQIKIGANIDSASGVYREKWAAIVRDVAARGAWEEIGMEPMKMLEIEQKTRFKDWTNPQLSAIYWADKALAFAKGEDRAFLAAIIRQAMVIYSKTQVKKVPAAQAGKGSE